MFNKEYWKNKFKEILSLDSHPGHISAGFAVGVFISFTPFFGFHAAMAIAAAFLLRLNKVTCLTGSCINTPLTVIPVLGLGYKLGELLMGRPHQELVLQELTWEYTLSLLDTHGTPILIGSSIIGFFAAILAYFLCYYLIVRFRRKDETLAELTREMEEVGEDIGE